MKLPRILLATASIAAAVVLPIVVSAPAQAATSTKCYGQVLREGDKGNCVEILQTVLEGDGYGTLTLDGIFGTATYNEVRYAQQVNSLTEDGIVGSATWTELCRYPDHGTNGPDTAAGCPVN